MTHLNTIFCLFAIIGVAVSVTQILSRAEQILSKRLKEYRLRKAQRYVLARVKPMTSAEREAAKQACKDAMEMFERAVACSKGAAMRKAS